MKILNTKEKNSVTPELQALFSTWMPRNVTKSQKKPDLSSFPLSYYAKKLKPRYLEKTSVIGVIGIDRRKHFQADCLPPVESTDLLFHLVLETQQWFKAFRSLEAYNQMVPGFIASI